MIALHTAPMRLRTAILEYLYGLYAFLRRTCGVAVKMPEFTAADLVKINAPIRLADLHAGYFLPPRRCRRVGHSPPPGFPRGRFDF